MGNVAASGDHSRRLLVQLKWLSTLVPGAAVLVYETVRYETLEHLLPGIPPIVGNVAVALLVLLLTYAFASFAFRVVERVQADAVRRGRELAALNAVIDERARLSRELHDGFAQLVAYMLVRLDTVTAGDAKVTSGMWHELRVEVAGTTFRGFLDGKQVVESGNDRFKSGGVGLWTKSDSVTCFDDIEVTPF